MLTKGDLLAIQKMFNTSRKQADKKFDGLSNRLQKNTEELVELITTGFNLNEERFVRIEKEVFKSN